MHRTFEEGIDYRLSKFTAIRRKKLVKHKDRGLSWIDDDAWDLLERLVDEKNELEKAILHGSPDDIARECANVANFAMMIADVVLAKGGE